MEDPDKIYDPLLPAGIHPMPLEAVQQLCVDKIGGKRRAHLFGKLVDLLARYNEYGIEYEAWINGSFVTTKPEPADVDLAIFTNATHICNLPGPVRDQLDRFQDPNEIRVRYDCDCYFIAGAGVADKESWQKIFGGYHKEPVKGFIKLTSTEVEYDND